MAHVSFWQLGLHCVTAMLTPLPFNCIKLYCANTKLTLILIYRHAHCIESFKINAANTQYATKQCTFMISLFYRNFFSDNIKLFFILTCHDYFLN